MVGSVDMPFDTLSEMIQQNSISWGTMKGVALDMLFRRASFEPYTSVYAGMDPVEGFEEGLQRVYEGNLYYYSTSKWWLSHLMPRLLKLSLFFL